MCEEAGQRRRARAAAPAAQIKEQEQEQEQKQKQKQKQREKHEEHKDQSILYKKKIETRAPKSTRMTAETTRRRKIRSSGNGMHDENEKDALEFGGPIGVTFIIIWSHYILLYFWYCLETNKGYMVMPMSQSEINRHLACFAELIARSMPTATTIVAYVSFFSAQLLLAAVVPGITVEGTPAH